MKPLSAQEPLRATPGTRMSLAARLDDKVAQPKTSLVAPA